VAAPPLLLVPSFTELEWGILPALEEWTEVATFDTPGVGDEPLPPDLELDPSRRAGLLTLASLLSATSGPRQPAPDSR